MTFFLALVVVGLAAVAVAYPLLNPRRYRLQEEDSGKRELFARRDTVYGVLKELESDYQIGTMGREDYKELEERYRQRAILILKELDEAEGQKKGPLPPRAEAPSKAPSHREGLDVELEIEKAIKAVRGAEKASVCPRCGSEERKGARFCSRCGSPIGEKS